MIKKKSRLPLEERKYCSCLAKVRPKIKGRPYGICTKSVYGSRKIKRRKVVKCFDNYDFKQFSKAQLKAYKKETQKRKKTRKINYYLKKFN